MISIITSSYDEKNYRQFERSIAETIGDTPYELIRIFNPGLMGICQAYNKGVKSAKFDILCFSHDDVLMKSLNWGTLVVDIFKENPAVGLVGIAGNKYKSFAPSGWSLAKTEDYTYINLIQAYKKEGKAEQHFLSNPTNERLVKVACIDGVWFCTTKQIALDHPFDENLFKNYHCYDIDYSLSVFSKYDVAVTFDILIKHYSEGNVSSKEWVEETIKLYNKWAEKTPFAVVKLSKSEKDKIELVAFLQIIIKLKRLGYSVSHIYRLLITKSFLQKVSLKNMCILVGVLVKNY